MTASLETLDQQVTLLVNQFLAAEWINPFWAVVTNKFTWFPLYALLAYYIFRRIGWKRMLILMLAVALTIILADQIATAVKLSSHRLRPCYDGWMLSHGVELPIGQGGGRYGFFSGHAANSFALMACLAIGVRSHRGGERPLVIGGYCWAALLAISRIAVARHFLGDILVGTLWGLFVGVLIGFATRALLWRIAEGRRGFTLRDVLFNQRLAPTASQISA